MLKKYLFLLAVLGIPFFAFAATVHIGGDYFLKGAQTAADDVYILGESATFAGTVLGDAVAIGAYIVSESVIKEDALFIGERMTVGGTIGDDMRVAGESVTVSGTTTDDVVALGAQVHILPSASIGGDLYIIGAEVMLAGEVKGNVRVFGKETKIAGTIGGNLESWGGIELRDTASIGGDFIYHAPREIKVPETAHIGGSVLFSHVEGKAWRFAPGASFVGGIFSLHALMMLGLGFALFFLARDRTEEVLVDILPNFGRRLLRGLLIAVCAPLLITALFASIVGIPVALVFLCFYVSLIIIGSACGALMLGCWFERLFWKRSAFPFSYRPVVTGTLALSFVMAIPLIGFAVHMTLLLASIGGIGTVFFRHLREMR